MSEPKTQEEMFVEYAVDASLDVASYSGRGMYGKRCVSIRLARGDNPFKAAFEVVREIQHDPELVEFICEQECRQDSLGLGMVIYFPYMEWEKDYDKYVGDYKE